MKRWISAMTALAVGASLGLGIYDGVSVTSAALANIEAVRIALHAFGLAVCVSIVPAALLGVLVALRVRGEEPRATLRRLRLGLDGGRIVGFSVGLGAYWALLGSIAFLIAENVRTDPLRIAATALMGLLLAPLAWLCGAASARLGSRLRPLFAMAVPLAALVLAAAAVMGGTDTLGLLGDDVTIASAMALTLGVVGWTLGVFMRRALVVAPVLAALAVICAWLPLGTELRAVAVLQAPVTGMLHSLLPFGAAQIAIQAPPPPPPFRLTPQSPLRKQWPIILIFVDSLRPDHLGCYGYRRPISPRLDAFARRSLRFERAYTVGSSTRFVVPAIMASKMMSQLAMRGRAVLPANVLLAELLRGYERLGFVAFTERRTGPGLGQGLDVFRESLYERGAHVDRSITDDAIAALEQPRSAPLFLWVHYFDPHTPYQPMPDAPRFGSRPADRYDSEVWATDRELGRLIEAVDRRFGPDGAVIILASDHGEAFGEHGRIGHEALLYEELVRVPLLVRVPGARMGKSDMPVSLLDLMPTILDLTGFSVRGSLEGVSLLPFLQGGPGDQSRIVFQELRYGQADRDGMTAAHDGRNHLILHAATLLAQMFDVRRDPLEQRPLRLYGPLAGTASRLRRAILSLRARIDAREPSP